MYYLYLMRCDDDSIYTGITTDIARRFKEHAAGSGGRYTKSRGAVKILHTEEFPNKSKALKREAQIKGWPRQKKLNLINIS